MLQTTLGADQIYQTRVMNKDFTTPLQRPQNRADRHGRRMLCEVSSFKARRRLVVANPST